MEKTSNVIGSTIGVRIVGHADFDVPAKIDTGADSSAIWASDIVENDGVLSFKLFAPNSIYYSDKLYETSDYKIVYVKNSFGHGENRYKVKLDVKFGGKKHKILFSLADRSKNTYPILIGRKFLKNKYLVDVSRRHDDSLPVKPVLVLVTKVTEKIETFFNEVQKTSKSKIILSSFNSLRFEIDQEGKPLVLLKDGTDIADYKLVYLKSYSFCPEQAFAVAKYLKYKNIPFFDKELLNGVSRSKLSELFCLSTSGIPVPQTLLVTGSKKIPKFDDLVNKFGSAFVIKDAFGDRGRNNYLVSNQELYNDAIHRLKDAKVKIYVIQKFIPNDGFLRVLLMNGKVSQLVFRNSAKHKDELKSHLNKPNGGVNAVELPSADSDQIALAQASALVMGRTISGVDLIQDKSTKRWYVLEVNYNPEMIGGLNTNKKAESLADMFNSY